MLLLLWGYDTEYGSDCLVVIVLVVVVALRADEDDNEVDVDRAEYCAVFVAAHEDCMGCAVAHQNVNDNTIVLNKDDIFGENEILLMYSAALDKKMHSGLMIDDWYAAFVRL